MCISDRQMRAYLNGDWRAQLPEDLDAAIVPVDKLTNNVGETQDVSAVTATSDSLWLFSVAEQMCIRDRLEDLQAVYHTMDITDEIAEALDE